LCSRFLPGILFGSVIIRKAHGENTMHDAVLGGAAPPASMIPAALQQRYRFCGAHKACRPDGEALPLSDPPLSNTPMSEVLRTGRSVHDRKVMVERRDGTRITVLGNLEPLRDETGEIIGGVNCFQDISELERAETNW
jgi:hypothetical protein